MKYGLLILLFLLSTEPCASIRDASLVSSA